MAIIAQILDMEIHINNSRFSSINREFAAALNESFSIADYGGYTPWPDYTLAEMACKALGGKIIEATDPPEYVEGRVY